MHLNLLLLPLLLLRLPDTAADHAVHADPRVTLCVSAAHRDDANDGEHFSAEVTSSAFAGQRMVAQHRLVYGALGDHMHRDIHALALKTYTPDRWPHAS